MRFGEPGVQRSLRTLTVIAVVMLGGLSVARFAEVGLSANRSVAIPKDANIGSRSDPTVELPAHGTSVLQAGSVAAASTTTTVTTASRPRITVPPVTTSPTVTVPTTAAPPASVYTPPPPVYTPPTSGLVSPDRQVLVLSGDRADKSGAGGSGDAKEASGGGG